MNSNFRRQNNPGQFAAVLRWVIMVAFFSVAGLSYVYLKNQMHVGGLQKHALERELSDLISQNSVMETQIEMLESPTALQARLKEGFIKLIPISTQSIIRVRTSDTHHWSLDDRATSDFHPVSHETASRH